MTGSGVLIYAFKFLARGAEESAIADASRDPWSWTRLSFDMTRRNAMRDQHWW